MRIIRFSAENIKKLKVVAITPSGSLVQITGPNGSGKSSVLDAIYWALAGQKGIDSKPVRAGSESATITLDLGDVKVTRHFTKSGSTSLVVEAPNGARFPSPQGMLDKLLGKLTFDPLAFSRATPKEQLETLRKLVTIDIDIDEIDFNNRRDFEARAALNKDAKAFAAQADGLQVREDDPTSPIDESALLMALQDAATVNSERNREADRRDHVRIGITAQYMSAQTMREQAANLMREAEHTEVRAKDGEMQLEALPAVLDPVNVQELRIEIEEAKAHNARVNLRAQQNGLLVRHREAVEAANALTAKMDERVAARSEAIGKAAMPVEGLGFGDGEVTFNDLPLAQASSAEQLRVSVAIAMAGNPELRVLRIKDGSLLDESNLALIAEMADKHDYQVWIERVDASGTVGVVMEDGSASGAEATVSA